MDGIQYLVSEQGEKTAVLIDLKKYKSIWEDIYDILLVSSRENEPYESIKSVKENLIKLGKLKHEI